MSHAIPAQKSPYAVTAEAAREYWWCACGRSKSQPFCDGSHRGSGITPVPFTVAEAQEVWLCGCKGTGTKPFCDGSHNRL
jgi:CDGSH-type Zn-finger protein